MGEIITQAPILIGLGTQELIIILIIVILVFGVNKIPQLGKGLGEGIRNFKSSIKEISEDSDKKQSKHDNGDN